MKKLSSIIKALMAEIHISESELARRTGVGQPVVHRIASGETDNPKVATLSPIANFFAVSISQLIGDEPLPENRLPGTFNPGTHGWMQVPLLSWEQLLNWPNLTDHKPTQSISTDMHLSENAYALKVRDNTMEPRFPEGILIIIDPAVQPENRDFVIAHIEGQKLPTFKQYFLDGNIGYLKPLNLDFQATPLDKKHRLLGVVVQSRTDHKSL
jgi:SOS-response transcriptional repressor LexA